MSQSHMVKDGEHLSGIAERYGFAGIDPIWDHPANAALREQRQDPNVLHPGDCLVIPDREAKSVTGATQTRHQFHLTRETLSLRLKLQRAFGTPIADTPCDLLVGLNRCELRTDGEGALSRRIPTTATRAGLLIREVAPVRGQQALLETGVPIRIGALDPVTEPSGQVARLANLGYYRAAPDPIDADELASSIEEFQCENGLPLTGACDPATQARLTECHGC